MHDLQSGQVLDGRFHILESISRGGWSSVFKAIDSTTGRLVALKVPLPHVESDPAGFTRYLGEGEIGARLNHPNVLNFIPVDEHAKSRPYLVTEYLEGQTLADYLQHLGPLPVRDALCFGITICDALAYLHQHDIIHRDLKPGNIMLCANGSLRVMDFGIARTAATRRLTFGGFSPKCGTPGYMAPEQVKGQRGDARTDIYSLGAMLYEMMTGHTPFDGESDFGRMRAKLVGDPVAPRRFTPDLTLQVEEILLHALARDPADRYQSVAAMKADLEAPNRVLVTGRVSRLKAPALASRWWRLGKIACFAWLIPVLLFFAFFLMFSRR
jgi:serine/threonine protein kinase